MTARRALSLVLGLAIAFALIPATSFAKAAGRVRVDFVNTGEVPAASGHAEYRLLKNNRASFHVEAEDLAPANYDVTVDARGEVRLPELTFPDALRVRVEVTQRFPAGPGVRRISRTSGRTVLPFKNASTTSRLSPYIRR